MQPRQATAEASRLLRWEMAEGEATTVHVSRHDRRSTITRVVSLPMQPLANWCSDHQVADAIVGGFFIRAGGMPLGDLWIDGRQHASEDFSRPYGATRACVQVLNGDPSILPRSEVAATARGDLLQAGPMLVRHGEAMVTDGTDPEGFSAASAQFDSDITVGRFPRAALGISEDELIAVVCDGRSDEDLGMSLGELALLMRDLGADTAINLDGGGSASLVVGGELRNRPREEHGVALPGGRRVSTALTFSSFQPPL